VTFGYPWVLAALPIVAGWMWWEWRQTGRHAGLALKTASFCLGVLALSQPQITLLERRVAVTLLADVSASVPREDIRREVDLISRMRAQSRGNSLEVIPFAGPISRLQGAEAAKGDRPAAGRGVTNLEAAIRDALSRSPEDRVPRILLLSDGQENQGSVERALHQARTIGIPIDTYEMHGSAQPALQLESVALQSRAFAGERFPMEMVVSSPRAAHGRMTIAAGGKQIGSSEVNLTAGNNHVRIHAQLDGIGAIQVSGSLTAGELGDVRFDRVVSLRRPRVLLVSPEPGEALRQLRRVLDAAHFEVAVSPGPLPKRLDDLQVVLAVNQDLESWPTEQRHRIEAWVKAGGGFALLAGENNIYADHRVDDDPLQKMLPATLEPPRLPDGNAVVLIIDKSSSMTGRKIELARQSAIGVIENLRPYDLAGVLVLDNSFQWAVPLRKADDPAAITRLIGGIVADGGTNIAPALREAFRQVRRVDAVYKHIVLLTDGISEEGDSMALAKQASVNQVTISTIGLGEDVNRAYLEKIAGLAKGKSYLLSDYQSLEQLMVRDVEEHTGASTVERTSKVSVLREVGILEGTGMRKAPPLLGYSRFIAKPQAETVLQVDKKHPLLVRWQYGLGRSAVFASDAKARWAAQWMKWPGYGLFWTNLMHDLLPRAPETESSAEFDRPNQQIVVHYRIQSGLPAAQIPDFYVLGPEQFRKVVSADRITSGSYRIRVPVGAGPGLYRVGPVDGMARFPEVGLYMEDSESARQGSNPELLRQIAQATGGRFNPTPAQVFDPGERALPSTRNLWPALVAAAMLLALAELAERKGYRLPKSIPAWNTLKRAR
jgi:Ca-activated chloride channel family protein